MNYNDLTDEEFINLVLEYADKKSSELFEKLSKDSSFIDRVKLMRDNKVVKGTIAYKFTFFYNAYYKYFETLDVMKKFQEGISNTEIMNDEEKRISFFHEIFNADLKCIKILPTYLVSQYEKYKELKRLYSRFEYSNRIVLDERNKPVTYSKYTTIVHFFKKILTMNDKYKTSDELYIYLYDELNIVPYILIKYFTIIEQLYYISFFYGGSIKVTDVFSLTEIKTIKDISYKYDGFIDKYTYTRHINKYRKLTDLEYNNIKQFSQLLYTCLENNNNDYLLLIEYLIKEHNLTLEQIKREYCYIYELYKIEVLAKYREEISFKPQEFKIKDVYVFAKTLDMYSSLLSKHSYLVEIICGNSEDRKKIIDLSYFVKAFNKFTPSANENSFNSLQFLYGSKEGQKKIQEYIDNYEIYYSNYKKEQDKIKEKELFEKEKSNLDKYVKIISDFLDSKETTLKSYFDKYNVNSKEFHTAF